MPTDEDRVLVMLVRREDGGIGVVDPSEDEAIA